MTSVYEQQLPEAFPWMLECAIYRAHNAVALLTRTGWVDGVRVEVSSFAVDAAPTVEGSGGCRLWLSDVSKRRLCGAGWKWVEQSVVPTREVPPI